MDGHAVLPQSLFCYGDVREQGSLAPRTQGKGEYFVAPPRKTSFGNGVSRAAPPSSLAWPEDHRRSRGDGPPCHRARTAFLHMAGGSPKVSSPGSFRLASPRGLLQSPSTDLSLKNPKAQEQEQPQGRTPRTCSRSACRGRPPGPHLPSERREAVTLGGLHWFINKSRPSHCYVDNCDYHAITPTFRLLDPSTSRSTFTNDLTIDHYRLSNGF